MKSCIVFIFFLIVLSSCSSKLNVTKLSIHKMPTEFIFDVSIDSLKKVIFKELQRDYIEEQSQYGRVPYIFTRKDLENINAIDRYQLETVDTNEVENNRIYLPLNSIMDEYLDDAAVFNPIGTAYNYVFKNTMVHPIYCATFKLRIKSVDKFRTEVKVITLNPLIATGNEMATSAHNWGAMLAVMQQAEISTIEEYNILLRIGTALGLKEKMPPLVLP